jgi:aminomethyltransferase
VNQQSPLPADQLTTPLAPLHRRLGARMVSFAGYNMPLHYAPGILAEHRHCRMAAALFDVSHMGQALLLGKGADVALERLVCGDIVNLPPGRQRYSLLMHDSGGIRDDVMLARLDEKRLFLVMNASRKADDAAYIAASLPKGVQLEVLAEHALLALQGPQAAVVLRRFLPGVDTLPFLGVLETALEGVSVLVSRSGYTGEDGFEISVPKDQAIRIAEILLAEPEVKPAGLGARDTLRLEAGLCLYGADIDETTNPVEAALAWVVSKRRRLTWDFVGAEAVRAAFQNGPARLRVGLRIEGRALARGGAVIIWPDGTAVGHVTSGGFSPTLNASIAMGYVRRDLSADGVPLSVRIRGTDVPARVSSLPFVPHRYVH